MSWKTTSLFFLIAGLLLVIEEIDGWAEDTLDDETMDDELSDEVTYDDIDSLLERIEKINPKNGPKIGSRSALVEVDDEITNFVSKRGKTKKIPKDFKSNCRRWELC